MNTWDNTLPEDTGFAGDGDDEIRLLKADLKDRMGMDHQFGGELDPLEGDCEGYHKKVTMKVLDADPTPLTGTGVIYTKLVDDVVELFFIDETTGVVNQLTEQGVLSLNTLQNDLDGNHKKILNGSFSYVRTPASASLWSLTGVQTSGQISYLTLDVKKGVFIKFTLSGQMVVGDAYGYGGVYVSSYKNGNEVEIYQNTPSFSAFRNDGSADFYLFLAVGFYYIKRTYFRFNNTNIVASNIATVVGVSDEDTSNAYTLTEKGVGWS
jgi:hypothetical protein